MESRIFICDGCGKEGLVYEEVHFHHDPSDRSFIMTQKDYHLCNQCQAEYNRIQKEYTSAIQRLLRVPQEKGGKKRE